MAIKWLTLEMVKGMHLQSIAAAGGSPGIRDEGLLQSVVDRPRNIHAYGDAPSIHALAASEIDERVFASWIQDFTTRET